MTQPARDRPPTLNADTQVTLTWRLGGREGAYTGRLDDAKSQEAKLRERGAVLLRIHTSPGESYHASEVRLSS
jgi:hypothetical protein